MHVLADSGNVKVRAVSIPGEHPLCWAKVYMSCAFPRIPFAVHPQHRNFTHGLSCVMQVLTTSNITEAIDLAFVDRADIKAYIGNPGLQARLCLSTINLLNAAAEGQ